MRAVVDTNILVSGLLSADGPPARVLAAIGSGWLQPVVCQAIMAEYRSVLKRPRLRIRPDWSAQWLGLIEATADWVCVPRYAGVPPLPDADDWPFMAAAHVGGCPLITGNLKHYPPVLGVRVLSAREWQNGARGGSDELG
jgi:predicted nucleic acid-binding protein